MEDEPVFATVIGDRRFDDRLPDITPEGRLRSQRRYEAILRRCRDVKAETLSPPERLTHSALYEELTSVLDHISSGLDEWTVDPLQGVQVEFMNMESIQPIRSVKEGRAMLARWRAIGPFFDSYVVNLQRGMGKRKVPVRVCVEKVVDELEGILARPEAEWAFMRPAAVEHSDWPEAERTSFRYGIADAVRDSVKPGYARFLRFLKSEMLARARPPDKPGIMHLPDGRHTYAHLIKLHTSLNLTPEELHQTGLKEVARINGEISTVRGPREPSGRRCQGSPHKRRPAPSRWRSARRSSPG